MDIAKLTMETKNIEYEKLIWQNEIKTEADAWSLKQQGYSLCLPEEMFKACFDNIPTECICYSYGNNPLAFYWNRKTMAASQITVELLYCLQNPNDSAMRKNLYDTIAACEILVDSNDYRCAAFALKDGLAMDYFNMLFEKKLKVKDLYETFINIYNLADYGFKKLNRETFDWILESKLEAQKLETMDRLKPLPEVVTIYRGYTEGISVPEWNAYSWTTDIRKANFFATRLGDNDSEIIVGEVPKNKIIEFIDGRGEKEILVKYEDVEIKDRIAVWGIDKIIDILPEVYEKLEEYEDYIDEFEFISDVHGAEHTKRVLLHMLILCHLMNIPKEEIDILCTAVTYHDVGRHCDGIDDDHGRASREIYEEDVKNPSPIIAFLIEYHSLPDEIGYKEIGENPILSDNKEMVTRLYKIFKDADGLDRVRLGLKDLDITYLRTEYSKHLTKIARIFLDENKRMIL